MNASSKADRTGGWATTGLGARLFRRAAKPRPAPGPPVHRPIAARALLQRFTSLGDNCEFGLAQRRAGAEPLGLFRLASVGINGLIAGLADDFADLNPPTRLDVERPWGPEFITRFGDRGFFHHTLMTEAQTDAATLRRQEAIRIPFLRRLLLDELAAGETIFVHKSRTHDPARMHALHRALQRHGPNRLLWVEQADAAHPSHQVEQLADTLFCGRLDRFAHYGDAVAISFDGWLRLCLGVLERLGETLPHATAPTPLRIGTDCVMGGRDGVTCTTGGPILSLLPDCPVHTHAATEARATCGAVLTPQPKFTPGETITASVYLWLPGDFAGAHVAPALTHSTGGRTLYAVLQERNRWQRIWVSAAVPAGIPNVDFGVWLDLAAGDRFYTTGWCLERSLFPGDYLLAL